MTNRASVQTNKGLTLFEVLIYSAIFGLLISVVIAAAYPIMAGADRLSKRVHTDLEAAFVYRKVSAFVYDAYRIREPSSGNVSTSLLLDTRSYGSVRLFSDKGVVFVSVDGNTPVPLTASRTVFENFMVSDSLVPQGVGTELAVRFDAGGVPYGPYRFLLYHIPHASP